MSVGLTRTFDFLKKTENETAVDVLISGLDCPQEWVRDRALRTLIERRSPAGHREVFRRLPEFDEHCRAIINERPERLVRAARDAIQSTDKKVCATAFDAILSFGLYDALPVLLDVLDDQASPTFQMAAQTALKLSESFYAVLCTPESKKPRDLDNWRRRVTTALEEAVGRFYSHGCLEVVEAFLIVAKPQNVILRRILQSPRDSSHQAVLDVMASSSRDGVIRLLLSFLEDPQFPNAAKEVLANRTDLKYVENLLQSVGRKPAKAVAETLTRFDSFAWARPKHEVFEKLDDDAQYSAVQVITATSMDRDEVLEVLGYLLLEGKAGGRLAAAERLAEFKGPEPASLVVRAINDEDPKVRAVLLKQLRPRNVPGAMSLLIRMVENAHDEVRAALREALPEFTVRQFLANFDSVADALLPTAGHLVGKIDLKSKLKLRDEMECMSPVRRCRALLAASAMGLVRELEQSVILLLLSDDDHTVRLAAAKALADSETMPSWETLRDALLDDNMVAQEVAEASLLQICQSLAREVPKEEKPEAAEESEEVLQ